MEKDGKTPKPPGDPKAVRQDRSAAALRANLGRRKAQARQRQPSLSNPHLTPAPRPRGAERRDPRSEGGLVADLR